jgi:hypothetical protein
VVVKGATLRGMTEDTERSEDLVPGLLTRLITVAESIRNILVVWTFLTIIGAIVIVANR